MTVVAGTTNAQVENPRATLLKDQTLLMLDEENLKYSFVPMGEQIDAAVDKLAAGQIDVLIGPIVPTYARMKLVDFMEPYYLLDQHQLTDQLTMANFVLQKNTFAFALPLNSPLRHPLNLRLRSHQEYGLIKLICGKYFKKDEKSAINCEI